jgi:hypothetical protein
MRRGGKMMTRPDIQLLLDQVDGSEKKEGGISVLERACLEVGKVGELNPVIVLSIVSFNN